MSSNYVSLGLSSLKFRYFEETIKSSTWDKHDEVIKWAINKKFDSDLFTNKLAVDGNKLRRTILNKFENSLVDKKLYVFIHVPEKQISPAGFSIFNGYVLALKFMGVNAYGFTTQYDFNSLINKFDPNIILISDNSKSLSSINFELLSKKKSINNIILGLTASTEAEKDDNNLMSRLKRAKKLNVDFFYSFKSKQHIKNHPAFEKYHNFGYKLFDIEFGCNPVFHFPVESEIKDLDYIFLASSNIDKRKIYYNWLPNITKKYHGLIDGPGWHKIKSFSDYNIHNILYSRARIGLNLHIQDSITFDSELNERTYILAACGVPQLVDNPKLIKQRFSDKSLFVANNPNEYFDLFNYMLENPIECELRAFSALKEVYENHTIFLKLTNFLNDLNSDFSIYEK